MKRCLSSYVVWFVLFLSPYALLYPETPTSNASAVYVLFATGHCTLYDANQKTNFSGDGASLEGEELPYGSTIQTGDNANVVMLHYPDMTRITLDEKSLLKIQDDHSVFATLGRIWVKISKPFFQRPDFEVQTPNAVAVAHGTQFSVSHDGDSTNVRVFEGNVGFNNGAGAVNLAPGQAVEGAKKGIRISPRFFNMHDSTNLWWKQNLNREEKFENFLKNHRTELRSILRGNRSNLRNRFLQFHHLVRRQQFWKNFRQENRLLHRPLRNSPPMRKLHRQRKGGRDRAFMRPRRMRQRAMGHFETRPARPMRRLKAQKLPRQRSDFFLPNFCA